MATVIVGNDIAVAQLLARKGAVKLETLGMRRRGMPATEICRQAYGIKERSKDKVLKRMEMLVFGIMACRYVQLLVSE